MTVLPPDPAPVIERGRQAKAVLENGDFLAVVDDLSNYHLAAMVAAPPGNAHRDARDHHHLIHHALSQIVAELSTRVAAADDLLRRLDEPNEEY